jgi:hypothetical protein
MQKRELHDPTTMRDHGRFAYSGLRKAGKEKRVSFGNIATLFEINKRSVNNGRDRYESEPQPLDDSKH